MSSLTRRQKIILFGAFLGIILGFIIDNTIAPPFIDWLKNLFGLDEIHLYITSVSIQAFTIALGIFIGFIADRWKARREITEELVKILPLVEYEIRVNYRVLQHIPLININEDDFMLDYWQIYKNDVAKWAPINITVITEIYGLLSTWGNEYDKKARIIQNSAQAIETWVDWYAGKLKNLPPKSAHKKRKDVITQLQKLDLSRYKKNALEDMKKSKKYPSNPTP